MSGDYGFASNAISFVVDGAEVKFEDLTIQDSSGYAPIGIEAKAASVALERSVLTGTTGTTGYSATGIAGDGSLSLVDSVVSDTTGFNAEAISFSGDVSIERSTISDTYSAEYRGGVFVRGDVQVVDSSFVDNTSGRYGEILRVFGSLAIENSTFARNGDARATTIIDISGDLFIVNSTLSGNATGETYISPGGVYTAAEIYVRGDSTATIVNSTLTGSVYGFSASGGSGLGNGIYVAPTGRLTISNSIIDGTIVSNGANTFRDAVVSATVAGDQLGVAAEDVFATTEEIGDSGVRAGVLADNGGPTETVALLDDPANPALDRADPASAPPTDQRGLARDAAPDIGAFELGAGTFPPLGRACRCPTRRSTGCRVRR